MAESILDTLMTTLTDIEITDNGQALDLFNKNRERDIVNFVSTILKEDVPMPEIVFDQASIDTLNDYLGSNAVVSTTAVASCDFADSSWTSATISVAFGAIYNETASNKLCVVLDFSGTKTCTNGTFTVSFPSPATAADAIISMA